jgi:hypothetical protein
MPVAETWSAFLTGKKRAFTMGRGNAGDWQFWGGKTGGQTAEVHTAQKGQRVNPESCARLGQRRQSPVFSDVRQHAEGRHALDEGHESD